jgi:predicted aspartyl protease
MAITGRDDDAVATIDTGFNGELMMSVDTAVSLGVTILENSETVQLGDNSSLDVRLDWLGERREVSVFVSPARSS